jgi:branched-chain amino acid transport system substrate-binding protein
MGRFNAVFTRRVLLAPAAALALGVGAWAVAGSPAAASSGPSAHSAIAGVTQITNFVKYVGGQPKSANPKLSPALIGWSSNNSGGTVISVGPEATAAAEVTVKWINKYADGIDGHPLQLDECIVKNAEEEGLGCAQGFLNNKNVSLVTFGALSVGAQTEEATIDGKKPIIQGFSLNNRDVITPNEYVLFAPGLFQTAPASEFAKVYMHAKSVAIIYPNEAGLSASAAGLKLTDQYAGLTTKVVAFDPTTSDLTGALTAAGAQTAGMIFLDVTSPQNCIAAAKDLVQLGISPHKVIGFTDCTTAANKPQFPGGDFPQYYYSLSQSGSALVGDPTGVAFTNALAAFGDKADAGDDWYSGMFGLIATDAQLMNKVGYSHLTAAAVSAAAKAFKGPLLLGSSTEHCGEFKALPAACADSVYFFQYQGKGKWAHASGAVSPPPAFVKLLQSRPANSGFPG